MWIYSNEITLHSYWVPQWTKCHILIRSRPNNAPKPSTVHSVTYIAGRKQSNRNKLIFLATWCVIFNVLLGPSLHSSGIHSSASMLALLNISCPPSKSLRETSYPLSQCTNNKPLKPNSCRFKNNCQFHSCGTPKIWHHCMCLQPCNVWDTFLVVITCSWPCNYTFAKEATCPLSQSTNCYQVEPKSYSLINSWQFQSSENLKILLYFDNLHSFYHKCHVLNLVNSNCSSAATYWLTWWTNSKLLRSKL